jgi:FAD/FMN-containing dehydrogenase
MLGLAVDQVLEMEVVMPCGKTVIANQVLNADLFWAMRGVSRTPYTAYHLLNLSIQGGGATFGVMTSVTLKTFPEMPFASASVLIGAAPDSEAFWVRVISITLL